jgi:hypothetical protein
VSKTLSRSVLVIIFLLFVGNIGILISSCQVTPWNTQAYCPEVISDGSDGVIVVYDRIKNNNSHEFYVQRFTSDGKPLWGENGLTIGDGFDDSGVLKNFRICGDNSGGCYILWNASTPSQTGKNYRTHITRVNSSGKILWEKEIDADNMIFESGDIILGEGTRIIKMDSSGNLPWGEGGIALGPGELCLDNAGGVISAWIEREYPSDKQPGESVTKYEIHTQRIDSEGNLLWGEEGMLLFSAPENTFIEDLHIIDNGFCGAIIVWHMMYSKIDDAPAEVSLPDIYIQIIDSDGNILLRPEGLCLEINKATEIANPIEPRLVKDDNGGAIIVWRDFRNKLTGKGNLYAQRIDKNGNIIWHSDGAPVSSTAINPYHLIVSDGSGGAICCYDFTEDSELRLQKIGPDGNTLWHNDGVTVTETNDSHSICSNRNGGAFVAWCKSQSSYIQRFNSEGKPLWGDGLRLN